MADTQAAKSLMIISYQLLTENISALHRYASLKAFFILDVLEVGFWIAAIVLTVMGMLQTTCHGLSCTLSGVVIGLAAVLACVCLGTICHARRSVDRPGYWVCRSCVSRTNIGDTSKPMGVVSRMAATGEVSHLFRWTVVLWS